MLGMTMEHTPGPWRYEDPFDGGRVLACDEPHTVIHTPGGNPHDPQEIANARLIASAPDLLASLRGPFGARRRRTWSGC